MSARHKKFNSIQSCLVLVEFSCMLTFSHGWHKKLFERGMALSFGSGVAKICWVWHDKKILGGWHSNIVKYSLGGVPNAFGII